MMNELNKALAFNDQLLSLAKHPDVDKLARGIGPVSLVGNDTVLQVLLLLLLLLVLMYRYTNIIPHSA